jgi:Collagen triple helix repeat (20 copies)
MEEPMSGEVDGLRSFPGGVAIKRAALLAATAGCIAAFLLFPSGATALLAQTWVASYGSDSNTGTASSPYADFATAVANTASGGEVNALTSGDFGAVTITEPITINGNGNDASIDFAGDSEGVYIDLATPGTVRLEGLDINGEGTGDDAVFDEGATVEIDNCDLDGFADIGVGVGDDNTTDPAGDSAVITNTTIDGGELGVRTFQSSGFVGTGAITLNHDTLANITGSGDAAIFTRFGDSVTVDNTSFYNNETDYQADTQNWNATFDDDVMTGTMTSVFTLYTTGGVTSNLEVDNSQITANDGAVFGDDGGVYTAELTGDEIEDNPGGGVLLNANSTLDDDTITGNGDYGLEGGGPASIDDSTIDDNAAGVLNTGGTMTISNSTIDGNIGDGVSASGATALDVLSADTISQNGTGLESDTGGQIAALGANNSIYGNTTNGSPTSTVTTGAVGPTGATGTSGPQGIPGTNGSQGPAGSVGPAGTNGSQGPAGANGEIELVTCTNAKKKVKHKTVARKKCTSKLVSSPVSFTASAASASISRAGHVDATGSLQDHKLTLHTSKTLPAGRYTLKLRTGTGKNEHTRSDAITIT